MTSAPPVPRRPVSPGRQGCSVVRHKTRGRRQTAGSVSEPKTPTRALTGRGRVCKVLAVHTRHIPAYLTQLQPRGAGPATQHPTGEESGPTVWFCRVLELSSFRLQACLTLQVILSFPKEARRLAAAGIAASRMDRGLMEEVVLHAPVSSRILRLENESKSSQVCGWCN